MGKKSVSKAIKERIIGMHLGGHNYSIIARTLGSISVSCVRRTVIKYNDTGTVDDKRRSGAPRKTSITDDNLIYRIARRNPELSAQEITDTINSSLANHISRHTVNRRLIDRKLSSYVASRKPLLKPTDRIKRINFCRKILRMTDYQLKKIIFSDESNYAVINRKNRKLVRRHQNEKYNMRFIVPRLQGGGGSVGIWGCITYDGPGLCSIYDGRMDQHKYIETLENHLIPTIDLYFGDKSELIFQQDNAPCHKAKTVKSWFEENQIQVIEWPARSPDLNPIENVWAIIDKKLTKNPSTSIENLRLTLKSSFDALDVQYCQNLFNSIKKRCKLCIANKGGHIPY
jgi:transposase